MIRPGSTLEGWLLAGLAEAEPPFELERIPGGYSMITYRMVDRAGHAWVLRHPPAGQAGGGAHDPARESRTMSALWDSKVPVPRVRIAGTAPDPVGLPCHVTDFVDGMVVDDADKAGSYLTPSSLRTASTGIVTALADLHAVDPDAVGLGDLGPKHDYNGRQVRRWRRVLDDLAAQDSALDGGRTAALAALGSRLAARLPHDRAGRIVHGDYRLGNAITGPHGSIRAILDWELVTLGEPLADLALLLVYWNPPPGAMLGAVVPTAAPGALTEDEAMRLYAARTGAELTDLELYRALACWRLACLCLRTALRFESGAMDDSSDPRRFVATTDIWVELTRRHLAHG